MNKSLGQSNKNNTNISMDGIQNIELKTSVRKEINTRNILSKKASLATIPSNRSSQVVVVNQQK